MFVCFLLIFAKSGTRFPDLQMHEYDAPVINRHYNSFRHVIDNRWGKHYKSAFLKAFDDMKNVSTDEIIKLANHKYPPALYFLGEMYLYGIPPVERNISKAYEYYSQAAVLNFTDAYSALGFIKYFGLEENAKPDRLKSILSYQLGHSFNSMESTFSIVFDCINKDRLQLNTVNTIFKFIEDSRELRNAKLIDDDLTFRKGKATGYNKNETKYRKYMAKQNSKQSSVDLAVSYFNNENNKGQNFEKSAKFAKILGDNHSLYQVIDGMNKIQKGNVKQGKIQIMNSAKQLYHGSNTAVNALSHQAKDPDELDFYTRLIKAENANAISYSQLEKEYHELERNNMQNYDNFYHKVEQIHADGHADSFFKFRIYHTSTKYKNNTKVMQNAMRFWYFVNPYIPNQEVAIEWYNNGQETAALLLFMRIAMTGSQLAAANAAKILQNKEFLNKTREERLEMADKFAKFANFGCPEYEDLRKIIETEKNKKITSSLSEKLLTDLIFDKVLRNVDFEYDSQEMSLKLFQAVIRNQGKTKVLAILSLLKLSLSDFNAIFAITLLSKIHLLIPFFLLIWRVDKLLDRYLTAKALREKEAAQAAQAEQQTQPTIEQITPNTVDDGIHADQ